MSIAITEVFLISECWLLSINLYRFFVSINNKA